MKLPFDKFKQLREKVDKLSSEIEELRPKEEYILWSRSSKYGIGWSCNKFYTIEDMNDYEDVLTMGGTQLNIEIYKTKIV